MKLTLSPRHIFDTSPPVEEHGAMMIHMQKCHLLRLLAQNEEDLKEDKREKVLSSSMCLDRAKECRGLRIASTYLKRPNSITFASW